MHSALVRVQNTFGFFTTVAFCTALLTSISVCFVPQNPSANLHPVIKNLQVVKGRPNYYSTKREEYAHIKFDLDADLTSLFNWNTKQVFVWITAKYPSTSNAAHAPLSEAVIWDSIINSKSQLHPFSPLQYLNQPSPSKKMSKSKKSSKKEEMKPEPGITRLKNNRPKYQITDISGVLSERQNVTLELGWNVQPWVGALTWTMSDGTDFWRWKGVRGGKSQRFDMPSLKGKKTTSETIIGSGGTPKAAEASGVI